MTIFDLNSDIRNSSTAFDLWQPFPFRSVSGGHLVSLSLLSAKLHMNMDLVPFSIHSYFLIPGDVSIPVNFRTRLLKDGHTSKILNVTGYQIDQPIIASECLLHGPYEENTLYNSRVEAYKDEYVSIDEHLLNLLKNSTKHKEKSITSNAMASKLQKNLEELHKHMRVSIGKPSGFRRQFKIEFHEQPVDFYSLMAFASDLFLLNTHIINIQQKLRTNKIEGDKQEKMIKPISHRIVFHVHKICKELIFVTECTFLSEKSVVFEGKFIDEENTLIATVTQEDIITAK